MNMRTSILAVGALALLTACADDGTVTPQGGIGFEAPFAAVSAVRTPTIVARAFGRTVNNAAVVDSIVGEIPLLKQLDGRSRYQFYLVNGIDSSATPISHRQWSVRTDSLLDVNGGLSTKTDTARISGLKDFWRGGFFSTKLRFAVPLSIADSVHQRAAWLVLTIQADSTRPAFNDSTPRPLFIRFRNQNGTVTREDDTVPPDTLRGSFGDFLSPARQTRFVASGAGSLLFWDVLKNGRPAMRVDVTGLKKPPRGYYYQTYIIDSLSGNAFAWGTGSDVAGKALGGSDFGADSIIPTFRAVQGSGDVIGAAENYSRVDIILEPKGAAPTLGSALSIYSLMSVLRANIPDSLRVKRSALGTLVAIVTKGTLGGPPAPNIGVAVQAAGLNFNTLLGTKNTDSTGRATFTAVPLGETRVLAIPFGGSVVEGRGTVTSGQITTVRLVVP